MLFLSAEEAPETQRFILQDGQVIDGRIVSETEEIIRIETEAFGQLQIRRELLREETGDFPELIEEPILREVEAALTIEEPVPDNFWSEFRGTLEAGYLLQSGRTDRNEVTLRGDVQRDRGRNNYRWQGELLYGEQNDEKNNDRYGLNFRWRRNLDEHFFFQTLTTYEKDRIRQVRHRAEQEIGVGYKVFNTDNFKFSVGPGFTFQFEEFRLEEGQEPIDDKWNYLLTVNQDLLWLINSRLRVEQSTKYLLDPDDTEDYIVRFNAGLVSKLTERLSLGVRYQLIYENQTAGDVEKDDQRLTTSLGWVF